MSELREKFETFHAANPHIYAGLVRLAHEAKDAGRKRYGIWPLVAVLRWDYTIRTRDTGPKPFKISNDYAALYARKIMAEYPRLRGFFVIKPMKRA